MTQDDTAPFQAGHFEVMGAVCQYAAGGAGVSLHGPGERIAILNPTPSAMEMKQAMGRIHRMGGGNTVQQILFAAGTIEERVYRTCKDKMQHIDVINDGMLSLEGERFDETVYHKFTNNA